MSSVKDRNVIGYKNNASSYGHEWHRLQADNNAIICVHELHRFGGNTLSPNFIKGQFSWNKRKTPLKIECN